MSNIKKKKGKNLEIIFSKITDYRFVIALVTTLKKNYSYVISTVKDFNEVEKLA
jgi:hypothetical protein